MQTGYNNGFNIINFDVEKYSKDKKTIADTIGYQTLNRMLSTFRWNNMPKTLKPEWLELQLLVNGFSFITEVEGDLYAFYGGLGGEPDPYYQPTICVVANPALKFNKECRINEDGILMSNDRMRRGIIPLIGKYAGLLAENTITIRIADIMARITNIMSASDDNTIESAEEYYRQLEEGHIGIIEESPFLEDLKIQAGATQTGATRLTDLIEMEQYLKASLLNELGLEANYNMKRESLNSTEAQMGDDALQPLIDNMLKCRQEAAEQINAMYGTDISVELASAWEENEDTRNLEVEQMEAEVENVEAETEQIESETDQTEAETDAIEESEDSEDVEQTDTDNQTEVSDTGDNSEPEDEEDSGLDNSNDNGRSDEPGQTDKDKVREEEN